MCPKTCGVSFSHLLATAFLWNGNRKCKNANLFLGSRNDSSHTQFVLHPSSLCDITKKSAFPYFPNSLVICYPLYVWSMNLTVGQFLHIYIIFKVTRVKEMYGIKNKKQQRKTYLQTEITDHNIWGIKNKQKTPPPEPQCYINSVS